MSRFPCGGKPFFLSLEGPTVFYVMRHGQTQANARGLIQGKRDFALDDTGRKQALMAAAFFAQEPPDLILSSPLSRAAETASIIARARGLPTPLIHEAFSELDTGIFSGVRLDEAKTSHPEIYAGFMRESWEFVPGAESSAKLYARALSAWEVLASAANCLEPPAPDPGAGAAQTAARARRILCVSHGGFIQWLIRSTFGCETWMPLFPVGNCGLFELFADPLTGEGSEPEAGAALHMQWKLLNKDAAAPRLC